MMQQTAAAMAVGALVPWLTSCTNSTARNPQQESDQTMKWAMYTYTLVGNKMEKSDLDFVDMCKRTQALGIDGLDIIGAGYNKTWPEIRKIANDHGIQVVCYSAGVKQLESPDPADRAKGMDAFRSRLEIAQALGCQRIMMNHGGLSEDRHENRRILIDALGEALPLAKDAGVEVTLEHHNNPKAPFRTSADFDEAIAQLPDLRITYDSGNIHIAGEDPVQGFIKNQDHITHVHFKDFFKDKGGTCAPGLGIIDFTSLVSAMKAANYQGYINIEMGGKSPSGWEVYDISMEKLGHLIA